MTEKYKYPEALKTIRDHTKLKDHGADVRSIHRSCTSSVILKLRKNATKNCPAYKRLTEEVLGDGVQVQALTPEVTVQLKILNEAIEKSEVAQVLKGMGRTHIATIRLLLVDANLALKGRI